MGVNQLRERDDGDLAGLLSFRLSLDLEYFLLSISYFPFFTSLALMASWTTPFISSRFSWWSWSSCWSWSRIISSSISSVVYIYSFDYNLFLCILLQSDQIVHKYNILGYDKNHIYSLSFLLRESSWSSTEIFFPATSIPLSLNQKYFYLLTAYVASTPLTYSTNANEYSLFLLFLATILSSLPNS